MTPNKLLQCALKICWSFCTANPQVKNMKHALPEASEANPTRAEAKTCDSVTHGPAIEYRILEKHWIPKVAQNRRSPETRLHGNP